MAKQTKKQKALAGKLDAEKLYSLGEALTTLRELKSAKFDETFEIAMNLGVDPRHADQMVRGIASLSSPVATTPRRRWPPVPTRSVPKT